MISNAVIDAARTALRGFDLPPDFLTREEIEGAWRRFYAQADPRVTRTPSSASFDAVILVLADDMIGRLERWRR